MGVRCVVGDRNVNACHTQYSSWLRPRTDYGALGVQLLIAGLGCYRYWWREVGAAAGGWSNGRQKVHKTRFYSHQEKYHIKPKAEIKYTVTHTVLYDAFRKHIMYLSLRV